MKKIVVLFLVLALGAAIVFGALFVDRMAVNYITGQRRIAGEGFWGEGIANDGPVPGYAFLGFTRPSEEPPGFRIMRPWEMAREIGLERGDVVTSVEGETFSSSRELMSHLVRNFEAGETVRLKAVTEGEPERALTMTLRAFVRHPGDLDLPYEARVKLAIAGSEKLLNAARAHADYLKDEALAEELLFEAPNWDGAEKREFEIGDESITVWLARV